MRKVLSVVIVALVHGQIWACDICGCKLGGLSYGILPQYNSHFIGARFSQAAFNAKIDYANPYDEVIQSEDTYWRVDIMGRYILRPKIHLNVMIPYMHNAMRGNHQNVDVSGLGDPIILVYYNLINTGEQLDKKWKHSLLVGGGVKLPVGEFRKTDNGVIVNRNFQLGSGSMDYLLSTNYTFRYKSAGANIEGSYKFNTRNSDQYLFGNQLNLSSYFFYQLETTWMSILPYSGIYHEWSARHKSKMIIQSNTGGKATFATLGSQLMRADWSVNVYYQYPVFQRYNVDQYSMIDAGDRLTLGIIYYF